MLEARTSSPLAVFSPVLALAAFSVFALVLSKSTWTAIYAALGLATAFLTTAQLATTNAVLAAFFFLLATTWHATESAVVTSLTPTEQFS